MLAQEERTELMRIANEIHVDLRALNARVNKVINHLLSAADELAIAAADEKSAGITVTVQKVTYGKTETTTPPEGEVVKRRKCSICHEPGHRATTCPKAHIAFDKARGKGRKK